jgi:hypothetical protein
MLKDLIEEVALVLKRGDKLSLQETRHSLVSLDCINDDLLMPSEKALVFFPYY